MSEEEKKAIEFFEKSFLKKIPPYWYDDTISNIEEKIKTILNLIEKQSKEIEELNKALMTATLKIEGLKIEAVYDDNYVSKDKIKAKIEEIEKLKTDDENSIINKIVNWFINQLQSLLEKE